MKNPIRWKQRFENFNKAFLFLEMARNKKEYDKLQAAGLVQSFEFTFELGWKTLKDYLIQMGDEVNFPREVIKKAFERGLIEDGHKWILMLEKRNELSHTYNDEQAKQAVELICEQYFPAIQQVFLKLKNLEKTCTD
jgi:nucleotidyltransferase substrate binding protein (TIGR01987 family)